MGLSCSLEKYFNNDCSVSSTYKWCNSASEVISNMIEQIQNYDDPNYYLHRVKVGDNFYKYDGGTTIQVINFKKEEVVSSISFSIESFIGLAVYSDLCSELASTFINKNKIKFGYKIVDFLIEKGLLLKKEVPKKEHIRINHRIELCVGSMLTHTTSFSNYILSSRILSDFASRQLFCDIFTELLSEENKICEDCKEKTKRLLFDGLHYGELTKRHLGIWLSNGEKLECDKNSIVYSCVSQKDSITIVNR